MTTRLLKIPLKMDSASALPNYLLWPWRSIFNSVSLPLPIRSTPKNLSPSMKSLYNIFWQYGSTQLKCWRLSRVISIKHHHHQRTPQKRTLRFRTRLNGIPSFITFGYIKAHTYAPSTRDWIEIHRERNYWLLEVEDDVDPIIIITASSGISVDLQTDPLQKNHHPNSRMNLFRSIPIFLATLDRYKLI